MFGRHDKEGMDDDTTKNVSEVQGRSTALRQQQISAKMRKARDSPKEEGSAATKKSKKDRNKSSGGGKKRKVNAIDDIFAGF